jgi:hypothetical protein
MANTRGGALARAVLHTALASGWIAGVVAVVCLTVSASGQAATVAGLPPGVAAAALKAEPSLPVPKDWSFSDAFSRTSGTGRLIDGAFEWTDWLYDDYGAATADDESLNSITSGADALSPAQGQYVYPSGAADNDGADIFRAAVGLTPTSTIWRVDWNTLVDPNVPIAEWTFDTDDNASTGASKWPADANVSSPGIEKALVVSAKGAELIDPVTGRTLATLPTTVDMAARSFLVKVPRTVMPVSGDWRIRLAAGVADAAGTGFAVPTLSGGTPSAATAPRVYNVTFRTAAQEPAIYTGGPSNVTAAELQAYLRNSALLGGYGAQAIPGLLTANFWAEDDQAETLATGNVSKLSQVISWSALAKHETTSPPLVKGWSDRWYATDLALGQGVDNSTDANPAFLSRVQPYAVYLPSNYAPKEKLPLTWMLHSASANYNQYGAVNPRLVQEECEARDSICVSSEGFGGDGLYQGDAEHDFWQVWRQVALAYPLLSNRTVMSGYSMGGLGSFVLPTTYPADFSESLPLDGGFDEGCTTASGEGTSQFDIAAAVDRTANVRWVPMIISNSDTDELSPEPVEVANFDRYVDAGDRVTLFSTSTPEHITTDITDGFSTQVAALNGTPLAMADPGTIDYTWCPNVVSTALGLGPTAVYWLSGLSIRDTATPATTARIVANDAAIPEPPETEHVSASVVNPPDAPPIQVTTGSWTPGATPHPSPKMTLALTNVATVAIDTRQAKLTCGTITVTSNGPASLSLGQLRSHTTVTKNGQVVDSNITGTAHISLSDGTSTLHLCSKPALACPPPSGRLEGKHLGPITLGMTRARAHRRLPRFRITYNDLDNFCLSTPSGNRSAWGIRVGYPTQKLLGLLGPREREGLANRVVLALTDNSYYALDGVHRSARVNAIANRLKLSRPFHIGLNYWYIAPGAVANGILKVRHGTVQEVGIANKSLTNNRSNQLRFLKSFPRLA